MQTSQDTPILRFQTFVVALLLFAIFGVLGYILTAFGGSVDKDPRAGIRHEAREAARQSSADILAPIGWIEPKPEQLEAAAAALVSRPSAGPSSVVVPGSPTAIQQASAQPAEEPEGENSAEPADESGESGESAPSDEPTPSDLPDPSDESDPSDAPPAN